MKKYSVIFVLNINYKMHACNLGNKNCVGFSGVDDFVVYEKRGRSSLLLGIAQKGKISFIPRPKPEVTQKEEIVKNKLS